MHSIQKQCYLTCSGLSEVCEMPCESQSWWWVIWSNHLIIFHSVVHRLRLDVKEESTILTSEDDSEERWDLSLAYLLKHRWHNQTVSDVKTLHSLDLDSATVKIFPIIFIASVTERFQIMYVWMLSFISIKLESFSIRYNFI